MRRSIGGSGLLKQPGFWITVSIILFGWFIPHYYEATASVPPFEQLNRTQGTLVHEKVSNRKGWKIGLQSVSKTILFTCADRIGLRHTCYADRKRIADHEGLQGLPATILWYNQPSYLFTTQRRLVQLNVGDRTVISRSDTVKVVNRRADAAKWWSAGYVFLFILLIYLCIWIQKKAECSNTR